MKDLENINEELEGLSPFLAKMQQESDGFKVPDNYFNYLTESVMEQVKLEPQPTIIGAAKASKTPWYSFLTNRVVVGSLATLAIILATVLLLDNQPTVDQSLAEVSSEEFSEYVSTHIEEFEVTDFLEADLLGDISEIEFEAQEIDQYLKENIEELDAAILEQLL
ncbi:MAG: hypothetical protein AAGJ18_02930 [Bacteroidota bacterium]